MISLSEDVTIPSPPELVWPLLSDPLLVASCIPGATLTPGPVSGVYEGTVRVSFGPTVAVFRGEVRLAYDNEAHRVTVDGRGIDEHGQSRATASGVVSISGGDTTILKVSGSFNVTGPLETVVNAGGIHVARALLAEFSQNLAKILADEGEPAPEAEAIPIMEPLSPAMLARTSTAPPVDPAAQLSGGVLLRRGFFGWLRQIASRKR
jgi:carbon monoxide dehydrogenase subunit G